MGVGRARGSLTRVGAQVSEASEPRVRFAYPGYRSYKSAHRSLA